MIAKYAFMSRAAAAAISAALMVSWCMDQNSDEHLINTAKTSEIVKGGPVCATAKDLVKPSNEGQRYLAALFHKTGSSVDPKDPANDRFLACLEQEESDRSAIGFYNTMLDKLYINPGDGVTPAERLIAAKHEMRHRAQLMAGIDPYADGDVPLPQRFVLALSMEADAWLGNIEDAYEQKQDGDAGGYDFFMSQKNYGPMLTAYEKSLRTDPDKNAARRAAFSAFFASEGCMQLYTQQLIPKLIKIASYNTGEPKKNVLTDAALGAFADRADGNYMDARLMQNLQDLSRRLEAGAIKNYTDMVPKDSPRPGLS